MDQDKENQNIENEIENKDKEDEKKNKNENENENVINDNNENDAIELVKPKDDDNVQVVSEDDEPEEEEEVNENKNDNNNLQAPVSENNDDDDEEIKEDNANRNQLTNEEKAAMKRAQQRELLKARFKRERDARAEDNPFKKLSQALPAGNPSPNYNFADNDPKLGKTRKIKKEHARRGFVDTPDFNNALKEFVAVIKYDDVKKLSDIEDQSEKRTAVNEHCANIVRDIQAGIRDDKTDPQKPFTREKFHQILKDEFYKNGLDNKNDEIDDLAEMWKSRGWFKAGPGDRLKADLTELENHIFEKETEPRNTEKFHTAVHSIALAAVLGRRNISYKQYRQNRGDYNDIDQEVWTLKSEIGRKIEEDIDIDDPSGSIEACQNAIKGAVDDYLEENNLEKTHRRKISRGLEIIKNISLEAAQVLQSQQQEYKESLTVHAQRTTKENEPVRGDELNDLCRLHAGTDYKGVLQKKNKEEKDAKGNPLPLWEENEDGSLTVYPENREQAKLAALQIVAKFGKGRITLTGGSKKARKMLARELSQLGVRDVVLGKKAVESREEKNQPGQKTKKSKPSLPNKERKYREKRHEMMEKIETDIAKDDEKTLAQNNQNKEIDPPLTIDDKVALMFLEAKAVEEYLEEQIDASKNKNEQKQEEEEENKYDNDENKEENKDEDEKKDTPPPPTKPSRNEMEIMLEEQKSFRKRLFKDMSPQQKRLVGEILATQKPADMPKVSAMKLAPKAPTLKTRRGWEKIFTARNFEPIWEEAKEDYNNDEKEQNNDENAQVPVPPGRHIPVRKSPQQFMRATKKNKLNAKKAAPKDKKNKEHKTLAAGTLLVIKEEIKNPRWGVRWRQKSPLSPFIKSSKRKEVAKNNINETILKDAKELYVIDYINKHGGSTLDKEARMMARIKALESWRDNVVTPMVGAVNGDLFLRTEEKNNQLENMPLESEIDIDMDEKKEEEDVKDQNNNMDDQQDVNKEKKLDNNTVGKVDNSTINQLKDDLNADDKGIMQVVVLDHLDAVDDSIRNEQRALNDYKNSPKPKQKADKGAEDDDDEEKVMKQVLRGMMGSRKF